MPELFFSALKWSIVRSLTICTNNWLAELPSPLLPKKLPNNGMQRVLLQTEMEFSAVLGKVDPNGADFATLRGIPHPAHAHVYGWQKNLFEQGAGLVRRGRAALEAKLQQKNEVVAGWRTTCA